MQLLITATSELVLLPNGQTARRWLGTTPQGHPCEAYVVGIGANDPAAQEELGQQLAELERPPVVVTGEGSPVVVTGEGSPIRAERVEDLRSLRDAFLAVLANSHKGRPTALSSVLALLAHSAGAGPGDLFAMMDSLAVLDRRCNAPDCPHPRKEPRRATT